MTPIPIRLPVPGLAQLHAEARSEGYSFIDTLVREWESGANRFDGPGEALFGVIDAGILIAVGGLTIDPFVEAVGAERRIGRIRRVYVRSAWRNRGIGRALVVALVDHARAHFGNVRLRAENADAGRLYERLGFVALEEKTTATHVLRFSDEARAAGA